MFPITLSFDRVSYFEKPTDAAAINNRIGQTVKEVNSPAELLSMIERISLDGHTFCPATFADGKRSQDTFVQQQLIPLDFDNKDPDKKVTFEEIKVRAEKYDLPILFAYDTFSSVDHDKFRVLFLNDVPIVDRPVAEAVMLAMGTIFPEADSTCYRDVSKMYFGGDKEILYINKDTPTLNVDSVFRGLTYCLQDRFKDNHYKEKLAKFSRETGMALTSKGLLDVTVIDEPDDLTKDHLTEGSGASEIIRNGKTSPNTIVYETNIIANGEIFRKYYKIVFDCTENASVGQTRKSLSEQKNHRSERANVIPKIREKCKLFREFENGARRLHHEELFGLLNTMINIESGDKLFIHTLEKFSSLYGDRSVIWERHRKNNIAQGYRPTGCHKFCPYHNECEHSYSILSTAHPKRGTMEKVPEYRETFCSLDYVQRDTYNAIYNAFLAEGKGVYVIKAQTAAGKTTCYITLMKENKEYRFLIAAPTNLLKREIYEAAKRMGIPICMTPSLDEVSSEIPRKIWKHIQWLYRTGQHGAVHPFIKRKLLTEDIPCLEKYLEERETLKKFKGCVVTTHRYLMTMEEKRLEEFDSIIVDEDILFKSVISNQGEVTVSDLKKVYSLVSDRSLREKIRELLWRSEEQTCIEAESLEWDSDEYDKDLPPAFDISAFCNAEKFYFRRAKDEDKLKEDTFAFLKPSKFQNVKLVMVSATANEAICRMFFSDRDVHFYECASAQYAGELLQYPQKSMSRVSLDNNKGIIPRLMEQFDIAASNVITFMKENIGTLHFGNTEGSNTLQGQDILVIGTPFHAIFLYKLVAFYFGIDFDEDVQMLPQYVTHNGYRFWFNTFQNPELRAIQFWMLESELEQAVGRARLLRNRCKVHLFSNFPLRQAKMVDFVDIKE